LLFIVGTFVHNNRLDAYAGEVITIGIRRNSRNTFLTTLGDTYSNGARPVSELFIHRFLFPVLAEAKYIQYTYAGMKI